MGSLPLYLANSNADIHVFNDEEVSATNQIYFCKKIDYDDSFPLDYSFFEDIGSNKFMSNIKENGYTQVLFYLHGFNNQPKDVFYQTMLLQKLTDLRTKNTKEKILVIPIIWPCHKSFGIIRDYWDDQKSADMCGYPLGRAINLFMHWQRQNQAQNSPCFKYVSILAHSMGNRVLKEAINNWAHYEQASTVPTLFRNIFMVAADVTEATLEPNQKGSCIPYAAKNVVVYYAGDDRALQGSKVVNLESRPLTRRLGHAGPTHRTYVANKNVYGVDCDAINSKYDILGHTYFVNSSLIESSEDNKLSEAHAGVVHKHIIDTILSGKVEGEQNSKIKASGNWFTDLFK